MFCFYANCCSRLGLQSGTVNHTVALTKSKWTLLYFSPAFELDDNFDEELAVHEVVYNMLERDVVDLKSVNDDESMYKVKTKKFRDPTPKMKLRHEQVKNLYAVLMIRLSNFK